MKKFIYFILTIFTISATYAQVGINTDGSTPHSSAVLDVKSTSKAFYPPRMTTAEKEAIVGKQVGAVVFDITLNQLSVYNGTAWVAAGGSSFTLPFSGTSNASNNLLYIENTAPISNFSTIYGKTNSSATTAGIYGLAASTASTNNTAGVRGQNNSVNSFGYGVEGIHTGLGSALSGTATNGIAANLTSTNGFALKTQGKLQMSGNGVGTLGIGKILKSTTANGDAEWADLLPISEVKSISGNMIYIENTMASTNLPVILGVTNSTTFGAGVSGTSNNTAPTNNNAGIRGINKSINDLGYGVEGIHEGAGTGGYFSSAKGDGINAFALDLTNFADHAAIKGTNNSTSSAGTGVHGEHLGLGEGVYGRSIGGSGVYGSSNTGHAGYFQTSEGEVALYARTSNFAATSKGIEAFGKTGVYGDGDVSGVHGYSFRNIGVYGEAGEGIGTLFTYGVHGKSIEHYNGVGVYGLGKGIGVQGASSTASGVGIYGSSNYGNGIEGYSLNGKAAFFNSPHGDALVTNYGKVGIGTTSPAAKMDIKGTDFLSHFYYGANEDTYLRGGIATSNMIINDSGNKIGLGVAPNLRAEEKVDINGRLRIRSGTATAGVWFNNTTNSTNTGNGAFHGMVSDTETGIFIGGAWRFSVYNDGDANLTGVFTHASDKRLKRNISQLTNSLSDIYKINGYHYYWKSADRSQDLQTGLIAQEVQKIFPELVHTDDKGFLSVNYIGLIPHLLEAVKELKNENETLKANNNSFESRLEKLEQLVNFSAKK